MHKVVFVLFVLFTASSFAFSTMAQRRGRGRQQGGQSASARAGRAPVSPRIAEELGTIRWAWNHEAVVDYFRRTITARYQPQLRNKGQVEQDRLMRSRDEEIESVRRSYLQFNGAPAQRRWDSSFIGAEYTHNNNESMLIYEDPESGSREFFFFFSDRLWKRIQAKAPPRGAHVNLGTFVTQLEGVFGPGLRMQHPDRPDQIQTVVWQDATTRLHVIDNSTFYNALCLIYEEKATVSRLSQLRRSQPATVASADNTNHVVVEQPQTGNVVGDENEDVADRITGKIRRIQTAPGAQTGSSGTAATGATGAGASGSPSASSVRGRRAGPADDPLRGL